MNPEPSCAYRGRFAPSPTGPLHFGSLVAAVGSFLQARSQGGAWLLRIEDIDPPRELPGAASHILRTLEALGLHWDEAVWYQHTRHDAYRAAIEVLRAAGLAYACGCTRREIADSSVVGVDGAVYPGTCRRGLSPGRSARAWRVSTEGAVVAFDDRWQGSQRYDLARDIGDFVVQRADGHFAYQLAVVVDDAAQGITEVVRGADLLASTPRQIHLQRGLDLPSPRYAHLPVVVNAQGEKLSKQALAAPIDARAPVPVLRQALQWLGQDAPAVLLEADLAAFWRFAVEHWDPRRVPRVRALAF